MVSVWACRSPYRERHVNPFLLAIREYAYLLRQKKFLVYSREIIRGRGDGLTPTYRPPKLLAEDTEYILRALMYFTHHPLHPVLSGRSRLKREFIPEHK